MVSGKLLFLASYFLLLASIILLITEMRIVFLGSGTSTGIPQIGDVWNTVKGDFEVKNIGSDPVSATYIIQLRKVGA